MKTLVVCVALLFPVSAYALTAEWVRNPETDMREYNMYLCEGLTCAPTRTAAMKVATIPQPVVGAVPSWRMPDNKVGAIAVTAVDQSGNESPLSNVVRFDTVTPGAPTGIILRLSVDIVRQ